MSDIVKPSVSLHEVMKQRSKYLKAFTIMVGQVLTTEVTASLSQAIARLTKTPKSRIVSDVCGEAIHDNDKPMDDMTAAVYRMMSEEAAGQVLTPQLANYLSLRFAGNFVKCRASTEPKSWRGQEDGSWVIAEIVDSSYHVTPARHIPGAELTFLMWSGEPAGKKFTQFFTDKSLARMAVQVGLMKKFKRRTLHHREFVRLRLLLNIKSKDGLSAVEYHSQSSLNNRNKHRVESRRDKIGCKHETTTGCHFCPIGYKSCVNGTHPKNFIERMCKYGHKGWLSSNKGSVCLACQASRWWASHH